MKQCFLHETNVEKSSNKLVSAKNFYVKYYYQIFLMFKFGLVSTRNMISMMIILVLLLRTFELLHLHRFVNFFPRE